MTDELAATLVALERHMGTVGEILEHPEEYDADRLAAARRLKGATDQLRKTYQRGEGRRRFNEEGNQTLEDELAIAERWFGMDVWEDGLPGARLLRLRVAAGLRLMRHRTNGREV